MNNRKMKNCKMRKKIKASFGLQNLGRPLITFVIIGCLSPNAFGQQTRLELSEDISTKYVATISGKI